MDGLTGFSRYYTRTVFFFVKLRRYAVGFFNKEQNENLIFWFNALNPLKPSNRFTPGFYVFLFLTPAAAEAQSIEGRLDGYFAGPAAIHAGAGFSVPMGTYVRSGFDGAVGSSRNGISGRVDGFARFHLDPLRQHRWAPYGGGGLTARFDDNRSTRYYLLVFLGIDGPVAHKLSTSIEAGLGGGGRIGVILRQAGERR